MGENNEIQWDSAMLAPNLTEAEKALRDKFVKEYMLDHDEYKACLRVGFLENFAKAYAERFLREPYVAKRIEEEKRKLAEDQKTQHNEDKALVLNTLRVAMQNGPYASRVAAAREASAILGLHAPKHTKMDVNHKGGVMMVPTISNVEDWEKEAQTNQEQLVEDTQKGLH